MRIKQLEANLSKGWIFKKIYQGYYADKKIKLKDLEMQQKIKFHSSLNSTPLPYFLSTILHFCPVQKVDDNDPECSKTNINCFILFYFFFTFL